jgi:threonylcarbamoyladenosine tRNA methylthiotransferase CDKAL1
MNIMALPEARFMGTTGIQLTRQGKIFVASIGCIESNLTSSLYHNYFEENNWVPTDKPENADLIIVVTCGVTNRKMEQSIQKINQLEKRLSPHSFLVVAGCIPKIMGDSLKERIGSQAIIAPSPRDVESLIKRDISLDEIHANFVRYKFMRVRMKAVLSMRKIFLTLDKLHLPLPGYIPRVMDAYEDPRWFYINIASGCLHNCAFCAIKKAKGNVKSRSMDIIINEFEAGISAGHKKVVLAGDDTGAYGQDIGTNIIDLLERLVQIPGDYQIYIRNLEPTWLLKFFDKFIEIVKSRKVRAVTVPIQTGNDKVLRAMKRGHKIQPLIERLQQLNRETPYLLLLTHFMVGLPGEDKKAFKDTLNVLKEVRFEGIAPDRFYPHPATLAAQMDGQVSELTKMWRNAVLTADILWTVYFNRGRLRGLR